MASADSSGLEPMRIVQPLDGPPAGGEWSDGVDEIMDGDLAVMLADVTPASGVVLTPVTNFALRNRTEGTVTILSSLGAWRKLARIRRNPKVSLAFHTRRHGYSNRPEFVLVQGIASFSTTPDRDWLESIDSNWERFMGPRDRGLPWEWWTKAYQWERIGVHIAVERTVTWPTMSCGGAAEVDGSRLAVEPPGSQPAPGKGTGPRIDHRRAARRAARLPDTLLGWVGADGFPLVTPVSALRPVENGIVLQVAPGILPGGTRRAGLTAHWFSEHVLGQEQRVPTGWLDATDGSTEALYAPHTKAGYRLPPSKPLYRLVVGGLTRYGLRQARTKGFVSTQNLSLMTTDQGDAP